RPVHRNRGQVRRRTHRDGRGHHRPARGQDPSRLPRGGRMNAINTKTGVDAGAGTCREARIGEVVLNLQNISLAFGGVKALTDISFDVREHEIRAIIGPNGAGKSSMLNVLNGVYTPQQGSIVFDGRRFARMNPRRAAEMGIARTFQNLALFKGMNVLDNIMAGRNLRMKRGLLAQALRLGPAEREEIAHREVVENIIDFLGLQAWRKTPVGRLPYGLQKRVDLGRAL